jgi:hypothetical protein
LIVGPSPRYDLALSDAEWLNMTPRMLHALRKRQIQHQQREELLNGLVCSTTANFSFCRPDKALNPEVFMLQPFEHKRETPTVTGEALMKMIRGLPSGFVKQQSLI